MGTPSSARSFAFATYLATAVAGGFGLEMIEPAAAEAGHEIDESYFYTSLSSHGTWVSSAQFGWVWSPRVRYSSWRPYTVGRWAWTDYGEWLWVSDEPFGWATYHYGRWFVDPVVGWVWLPGRVWAPAWVNWRECDDYVGWAPLGPWGYYDRRSNRYRDWDRYSHNGGGHHNGNHHGGNVDHHDRGDPDRDDRDRGDRDYNRPSGKGEDRDHWNFTRKRDFVRPRVDKVMVDRTHLSEVYGKSRELPPPSVQEERSGRGVTRGVDRAHIERAAGRAITPVRIEDGERPPSGSRESAKADRVRVYRPQVKAASDPAATPDRLGLATKMGKQNPERRDAANARPEKNVTERAVTERAVTGRAARESAAATRREPVYNSPREAAGKKPQQILVKPASPTRPVSANRPTAPSRPASSVQPTRSERPVPSTRPVSPSRTDNRSEREKPQSTTYSNPRPQKQSRSSSSPSLGHSPDRSSASRSVEGSSKSPSAGHSSNSRPTGMTSNGRSPERASSGRNAGAPASSPPGPR